MAVVERLNDLPDLPNAVLLDPKDDLVVATAVKANAASLGTYAEVRIVSPRECLTDADKHHKRG